MIKSIVNKINLKYVNILKIKSCPNPDGKSKSIVPFGPLLQDIIIKFRYLPTQHCVLIS